jgi:hypothetical protein
VGGGDGDDEQRAGNGLDDFGQRLGEGELSVERARGKVFAPPQLARVSDPFVDKDQARSMRSDEVAEHVARVGPGGVGGGDQVVGLAPAELPGHLPPQGADLGPVRFLADVTRGQMRADQGDAANLGG